MLKQTILESLTATILLTSFTIPATALATNSEPNPTLQPSQPTLNQTAPTENRELEPEPKPTPKPEKSTLRIDKLQLQVQLGYETLFNVQSMEQKLLQGPVVETQEAAPLCALGKNAYIYGHSEPATPGTDQEPGVQVFESLNKLQPGDKIQVTDKNGQTCTYQVKKWEKINTNPDGSVTRSTFEHLVRPNTGGESWLTLQTCDKNDLTGRLILRAQLI
jgi:sortase (surface protein transpeptidase)